MRSGFMRLVIPFVLLAACTSAPETRGVVKTMPAHGADGTYQPDRPLEGAQVSLVCPDTPPRLLADTDERGRFDGPGESLPLICSLRIAREGYATRTIPVAEACAVLDPTDTCPFASVTARLVPIEESP
jgi:hypothetical protein